MNQKYNWSRPISKKNHAISCKNFLGMEMEKELKCSKCSVANFHRFSDISSTKDQASLACGGVGR